ncbi:unnamed protein product, partial [Mycena citricolor]
ANLHLAATMSSGVLDPTSPAYKKARKQYLASTKSRDKAIEHDWTPFRVAEKRFRARFPPPDLSDVLDLALLNETRSREVQDGRWKGTALSGYREVPSISPSADVAAYALTDHHPGLVILPGFLSPEKQRQLIRWCLADHSKHPNPTNLDVHYAIPEEGLWSLCRRRDNGESLHVQPLRAGDTETMPEEVGPRQLINNTAVSAANFEDLATAQKLPAAPSANARETTPEALLPKLRWANLGWFYHWGTKQYDFSRVTSKIDRLLADECRRAVCSVDWDQVYDLEAGLDWGEEEAGWKTWADDYEPDAGIVNFYQTKDTLMAHVDRSEVCATSPLVSISLGNAAIFLIGGHTRDSEPVPILLRSGDAVIMSGPVCRRAYHGVPRILENTLPAHLGPADDTEWTAFANYMQTTRVNINVRQVFPRGFKP